MNNSWKLTMMATLFVGVAMLPATAAASQPTQHMVAGFSISNNTTATTKKDSVPQTEKKDSLAVKEKKDTAKAKKDSLPAKKQNDYDKLIAKGGSVNNGLFTVRHIDGKWYFEVPQKVIGRLMLAVTRFTSVPQGFRLLPGEEAGHSAVYLERHDDKTLFMRAYAKTQVADSTNTIAQLVKESTVDPIVAKFDIIGKNPDNGNMLIEVGKFFLQDNNVFGLSSNDRKAVNVSGLQSDRSFIDTMTVYPINVEIRTLRTYGTMDSRIPAAQTGFVTLGMNTSIVMLPEHPMKPRIADERVGYFETRRTQFSDSKPSKGYALADRYRLEPKDPKAYAQGKLVEPKKQIVYYIDPETPKKWVPYLIAGINDWNKAFEAAGFKNAIVAKEVPAGSNISPDDARYCFLRYLPSETQNAYGPHIVDPRSGEIIEAHICWYHNVMQLVKDWYITQCGPLDKRAQTMNLPDKLMGELIRFVSSHEVGHTLGLRHNMIASSATPVEKLRDKKWVEANGHTVSIMDYARFNYVAQPEDGVTERGLFPRINVYDKWAIKWGYQYRPEFKDPWKEAKQLRHEVSETLSRDHRLAYCGDEGRGQDPRSQTESLGDDNMKASDYGIKNLKRVIANIEKWTAQPDGQYDDLNELYRSVASQFGRYCQHVQRNIGGIYTNNIPGMPVTEVVPRDIQKEAIDWIARNVFEAPLWLYPADVCTKLKLDADGEMVNRSRNLIGYLLSADMVANQDKRNQIATKPYPVKEYIDDVFHAVWQPLGKGGDRQDYLRRQLERAYVRTLGQGINPIQDKTKPVTNYNAIDSDARLYLLQNLSTVENFCKQQQAAESKESLNALHYAQLLHDVEMIKKEYNKAE